MNTVIKAILGFGVVVSALTTFSEPSYGQQSFECDESQQTTKVRSHWGELPIIRWSDPSFPPPWTPLERCREVTTRFNRFESNGTLKYMRAGMIGNNPVICVAGYKGGSCLPDGLLITLKYGSDPNIALTRIIDRRVWATSESVQLNDDNEDGLISEVDGTVYVDIEGLLNGKE